jgi:hypothetical protein
MRLLRRPKDPVRYRWNFMRFKALHWWRALEFMPWWLISYLLTAIMTPPPSGRSRSVGVAWQDADRHDPALHVRGDARRSHASSPRCCCSRCAMLFLLWLNFTGKMRSRADHTGLVVLAITMGRCRCCWSAPARSVPARSRAGAVAHLIALAGRRRSGRGLVPAAPALAPGDPDQILPTTARTSIVRAGKALQQFPSPPPDRAVARSIIR